MSKSAISEDHVEPPVTISPGEALLNSNGQDIVKKGAGKGRNKLLCIIPVHLALPEKFADGQLGKLRNLNTERPELVFESEEVVLSLQGRYEFPSTKFLSIHCQPSSINGKRSGQCILTDIFDKILVFESPIIRRKAVESNFSKLDSTTGCSSGVQFHPELSDSTSNYAVCFGNSNVADPVRSSTLKKYASVGSSQSGLERSQSVQSAPRTPSQSRASTVGKKRPRATTKEEPIEVSTECDEDSSVSDETISSDWEDINEVSKSDSLSLASNRRPRRASASKAVSYKEIDEVSDSE